VADTRRGRCCARVSTLDVDWTNVFLFQVDERVAPPGDDSRNLTHIRASLVDRVPLPAANVFPMPVERNDLAAAAAQYAADACDRHRNAPRARPSCISTGA
jgi:6-phosphogluconolactonase/glucosamine-6-phosphate isomerase/deaminase